jgi:hypothetical protein
LLNAKDGSLKQLRKDVCSRHEPVTSLLEDGVLVVEEWALIEFENHHIKNHTNAAINTSLTQKEKTTYLNIIGGLLELMLGETPAGNKQSVFLRTIRRLSMRYWPTMMANKAFPSEH